MTETTAFPPLDYDDSTINPRPEVAPSPAPIMFDIAEVPARRLKKDVLAAYHEVGGKDYLVRMANADPAQFNKLLAKILPQAIEADIKLEAKAVDLDSVTTSQLKQMYLKMMAENGQIIDVDTSGSA